MIFFNIFRKPVSTHQQMTDSKEEGLESGSGSMKTVNSITKQKHTEKCLVTVPTEKSFFSVWNAFFRCIFNTCCEVCCYCDSDLNTCCEIILSCNCTNCNC